MSHRQIRPWRLAVVAFLGAAALETILLFSEGVSSAFTIRQIPNHVAALAVGGLGGWIYELFRELNSATTTTLKEVSVLSSSVQALTSKISYQDKALGMLLDCPRHNEALTELIRASMSDNFKNIPFIGTADYLRFLAVAIEHADGYEGVQRRPLRWFRDHGAGAYLQDLNDKRMKFKTRLFVIDDGEVLQMEEDLSTRELVEYYWKNTGDVDTYWMSSTEFSDNFPSVPVPRDFALYDRQLLIAYDETRQILTFDVVGDSSPECRIFAMQRQLSRRRLPAMKRVSPESLKA